MAGADRSTEFVHVSVHNGVGWLEFDRPPVNAFTRDMVDQAHDAIAAALAAPDDDFMALGGRIKSLLNGER